MKNGNDIELRKILVQLVNQEEEYHGKKERLAWTASSIYFTFSIFTLWWLISNPALGIRGFIITIIISIIYVGTISFVSLQFLGRWDSLNRENTYRMILFSPKNITNSSDLMNRIKIRRRIDEKIRTRKKREIILFTFFLITIVLWIIFHICDRKRRYPWIDSAYRTEIPTYALITGFYFCQIAIIFIPVLDMLIKPEVKFFPFL